MRPSGIITLTTDFGLSDPYAAMMKGVILSINPMARLIDITHLIRTGAIHQAATVIHETFSFFPVGTVHVAVVDPGVGSERRMLGIQTHTHFFVGPDNGLFSSILQDAPDIKVYKLTESKYFLPHVTRTFHGRDIFGPVAAYVSSGIPLERMGMLIHDPLILPVTGPWEKEGILYGEIVHVDGFGNCITNISRPALKAFLGSSQPRIEVGHLTVKTFCQTYSEVEEGQPLSLINSTEWLEIAVNMGRASEYLGLTPEEIIGTLVKVERF